jgi:hypothetical protein
MKEVFQDYSLMLERVVLVVCLGSILFSISCKKVANLDSSIDRTAARALSDSLAQDLINDRRDSLRLKLETSFRECITDEQLDLMLSRIAETYGKPIRLDFKQDETGLKTYTYGTAKSMIKFWYAAKTTKYETGKYFLIVEVVPDGAGLGVATFSLVGFVDSVPASLR